MRRCSINCWARRRAWPATWPRPFASSKAPRKRSALSNGSPHPPPIFSQTCSGEGGRAPDWEIAMKHLAATLDKLKVPQPEREEFTAVVNKLKDDIVDKSAPKKSN